MKFSKIIGKCDPKIIMEAEEKLSSVFTELSLGFDNKSMGTGLGGCPLTFQLVYPLPHICDALSIQIDDMKKKEKEQKERIEKGEIIPEEEKIPEEAKAYRRQMGSRVLRTAATDGARFYWNPEFVVKQTKLGLRIVVAHEAWHAIFLHPSRRGSRLPRLWNIAVDYRVNFTVMEDMRARDVKDYPKVFTEHLGEYIHLEEYAAFLRDPFNPPARLAHLNPILNLRKMADPAYKDPYDDVGPMYYADPALSDDMRRPENIYDYLLAQIPKCPKCGRLGKYKKPEEYKALQKKIEEDNKKKKAEEDKKKKEAPTGPDDSKDHDDKDGHCCDDNCKKSKPGKNGIPKPGEGSEPGEGKSDDSCCGDGEKGCGCPECGDGDSEYIDPFGAGETLDDHIDSDVSEEELSKRITDATEIAKRMAGKVPGSLEDELGILVSPSLSVWDFIRRKIFKIRSGNGKSDWMKPKSRPMFAGLYVPKKRTFDCKILVAMDCSGSMSADDISFGLSQLQVLDESAEMWLLPFDTKPYYDAMVKIKKADKENLSKARRKGLGGTMVGDVFRTYKEHIEKVDMIVVISDGFIGDYEIANVELDKTIDLVWIITSHNPNFNPKIGRVFHLRGEKLQRRS
jgi:predicted metal-dependent peptidase